MCGAAPCLGLLFCAFLLAPAASAAQTPSAKSRLADTLALVDANRLGEAERRLADLVAAEPSNADARYVLGVVFER